MIWYLSILWIINKKRATHSRSFLFSISAKEKSKYGECSIEKEDFEAEFVAVEEFDRVAVDEYGGDDGECGYEWHEAVADVPFSEHAHDEESEQWTIGVTSAFEYSIDHAVVVESIE